MYPIHKNLAIVPDRGAGVSLICSDILNKSLLEELDTSVIYVFSGTQHTEIECRSIGTIYVPFKHDGHTYSVKFHVVDERHINLPLHRILGLNGNP